MEVKLAITDVCGASCATCLQYRKQNKKTLSLEALSEILDIITPYTSHLFINSVGDFLWLDNAQLYADLLGEWYCKTGKYMSITTNCGWHGEPKLNCSIIICSFNAHDSASFRALLGLDYERVLKNIQYLSQNFKNVEIHVLRWGHNRITDEELRKLFPGMRIRISEKVECHGMKHPSFPFGMCDYLQKLVIGADGTVELCSHDFFRQFPLGHISNLKEALAKQAEVRRAWQQHNLPDICQWCNYTEPARILKDHAYNVSGGITFQKDWAIPGRHFDLYPNGMGMVVEGTSYKSNHIFARK